MAASLFLVSGVASDSVQAWLLGVVALSCLTELTQHWRMHPGVRVPAVAVASAPSCPGLGNARRRLGHWQPSCVEA